MAVRAEITNMALFCDFENIALGVSDTKYAKFDIDKVLERLLLKGSIVVKKEIRRIRAKSFLSCAAISSLPKRRFS